MGFPRSMWKEIIHIIIIILRSPQNINIMEKLFFIPYFLKDWKIPYVFPLILTQEMMPESIELVFSSFVYRWNQTGPSLKWDAYTVFMLNSFMSGAMFFWPGSLSIYACHSLNQGNSFRLVAYDFYLVRYTKLSSSPGFLWSGHCLLALQIIINRLFSECYNYTVQK